MMTTKQQQAFETLKHRFYAWLLKHLFLPKFAAKWLLKKVSDSAQY